MRFKKVLTTAPIAKDPFADETSLGHVLMRMKKISKEQLLAVVGQQARSNEHLLGALLIDLKYVTADDVIKALAIQEKMRHGSRAHAALDMLDDAMAESQVETDRLTEVIKTRKDKLRAQRKDTGVFLAPQRPSMKLA